MSKPAKKEEGAVDLAASSPAAAQDVAELHDVIEGANKPQPDYQGIAILGSHPETVGDAPFNDKSWKIYACSPHNIEMRTLPRVDEWFEIHKPVTDKTRRYEYLRRLEENRVAQDPPHCDVIWMRDEEALPRFKDARPYPEKQLKDEFGPFFFTSSIAFMLAKAIVDCKVHNIPQIAIFGVMQATENEYTKQRPGIQYFILRAAELGIKVTAASKTRLFEPPPENF